MYNENRTSIKRKVAIYARVSTEHEAQLSALENQKDWYKPILTQNPEWELVCMYIDEGITGTSAKKRPKFLQMIKDAENGEFDLILTREVSRFARNTVDTLQYTRQLKSMGVEVFFLNDNIKTFDGDGELRLTIMATLAQDESRKTSIRVKSGQKTSMEKGTFYGNGNILGYDRVNKEMVINPEQAETVRLIYQWYLSGWGLRKIQFELEKLGRLTAAGKKNWHAATIGHVLKNPFYCGIIIYRKQFVPDYLEQKKINNYGDVEQIKTVGTHEPIVSVEEFERVQKIMENHRKKQNNNPSGCRKPSGERQPVDIWTKLMICNCGHQFNRKVWHRLDNETQYGYQCYSSIRTGTVKSRLNKGLSIDGICETPMIAGWKLQMMAKWIFKNYLQNTDEILQLALQMLDNHIDDKEEKLDNTETISRKQNELQKLSNRLNNLIEMRADGEITKELFKAKQDEISKRMQTLNGELSELIGDDTDDVEEVTHEEKLIVLKYALEQLTNFNIDGNIPDKVIEAFVRKIVVSKEGFAWYLRFMPDDEPPTSLTIEGTRKNNAKISSLCDMQHRQLFTKVGNAKYLKLTEFTVKEEDAKNYLYAHSTRHRIFNWYDFKVSIYI